MKLLDRLAYLVAGTALAAGVVALGPVGGGLEPPAGPVEDTSPSLAEIQDGLAGGRQEWEVFTTPMSGTAASSGNEARLIAEGRVLLHSVIVYRCNVAVFDGAGQFNNSNWRVESGNVVARAFDYYVSGGNPQTGQVVYDVVVGDGLYASYWMENQESHLTILYRRMP